MNSKLMCPWFAVRLRPAFAVVIFCTVFFQLTTHTCLSQATRKAEEDLSTSPANLRQILDSMDWMAYPIPEGAKWIEINLFSCRYWLSGDLDKVSQQVLQSLTASGWNQAPLSVEMAPSSAYRSLQFSRDGYRIEGFLSAKQEYVEVYLGSRGNLNSKSLPVPADAKSVMRHESGVSFDSSTSPKELVEYYDKELVARGWRKSTQPWETSPRYVWNAMELNLVSYPKEAGVLGVACNISVRSQFDASEVVSALCPDEAPKIASKAETLAQIDLQKFPAMAKAETTESTPFVLKQKVRGSANEVFPHFRNWFAENGWVPEAPFTDLFNKSLARWKKNDFVVTLELHAEIDNFGNYTNIKLESMGNGNLYLFPFPPEVEVPLIGGAPNTGIAIVHSKMPPNEIETFYKDKLAAMGWKEEESMRFKQSDTEFRVIIGSTREGSTQVQVSQTLSR